MFVRLSFVFALHFSLFVILYVHNVVCAFRVYALGSTEQYRHDTTITRNVTSMSFLLFLLLSSFFSFIHSVMFNNHSKFCLSLCVFWQLRIVKFEFHIFTIHTHIHIYSIQSIRIIHHRVENE